MTLAIVVLSKEEEFLGFLDPDLCNMTETHSEGLRTLLLNYKFQDLHTDKQLFKIGNKVWVSGDKNLDDCLYVINTPVETDVYKDNSFTMTIEEVLTELNYAPLFSQNQIKEENGFHVDEGFLDAITDDIDIVFLCEPNNPTGVTSGRDFLEKALAVCEEHGAFLVIDECFNEFIDDPQSATMKKALDRTQNLLILKAFTKVFAMAGVRLGFGLCSNAEVVEGIRSTGQPWAVSGLAQAAGIAALSEPEYVTRLSKMVKRERPFLRTALELLGLKVIPGEANYLLFRGPEDLEERMKRHGILIRNCSNYPGLGEGWFRTAVRTREDNKKLIQAMKEGFDE